MRNYDIYDYELIDSFWGFPGLIDSLTIYATLGMSKMHLYKIETHLLQLFLSADEHLQFCHEIRRSVILTSSVLRWLVSKNPSGCWRGHPRVHCCWYCCRRYSFVCRRAWFNCVNCGCLFHLLGFLTGVIEIKTILKTMQLCKWRQNRPFLL